MSLQQQSTSLADSRLGCLSHVHQTAAPMPIASQPADRPAPPPSAYESHRTRGVGILLCSGLVHLGLLMNLNQIPQELASIGVPAISVEIVLGDDSVAGTASSALQEEQLSTSSIQAKPTQRSPDATQSPVPEAQEDFKRNETHDETPTVIEEPRPHGVPPSARDDSATAVVSQPVATPSEVASENPTVHEPAYAMPESRVDQDGAHDEKPKQDKAEEYPERARPPRRDVVASLPPPASGVSRGRSSQDANYHGRVASHLARHKQFPPDARRRGEQGRASVTFSIDSAGRVTTVSLTRSTGYPSLDREAQSMVRRASPFPPPPGGQTLSFSVPVSFNMR